MRYPKEKLAEAYGLRWTIETAFAHLKTTMKMDVLRCQTVRGVQKELTMFLLVYNLVRMTLLEAAQRQGVSPDRISFVDALRWLATARPGEELPDLVVNPLRPGRAEPRVRKRRPKQYPLLQQPSEGNQRGRQSKGSRQSKGQSKGSGLIDRGQSKGSGGNQRGQGDLSPFSSPVGTDPGQNVSRA